MAFVNNSSVSTSLLTPRIARSVEDAVSRKEQRSVVDCLDLAVCGPRALFIENRTGSYIASPAGHYHKVSSRHVDGFQQPYSPAVSFSRQGLHSMREKYARVNGAPPFLRAILRLDVRSAELRALVEHPELSPYFQCADGRGGFLVINNQPYDPTFDTHTKPKSQKLRDAGIHLCAWFIHPEESSLSQQTRALLRELVPGHGPGPVLQRLRLAVAKQTAVVSEFTAMGNKPNRELLFPLTSILDLRPHHGAVLAALFGDLNRHLRQHYGVYADQDQVDMFCHWPYRDVTTPLHVQVRVNQTIHPTDASSAFHLDELIVQLLSRRSIDTLIRRRQKRNGGCFYRPKVEFSEFGDLSGVAFSVKRNVFRLDEGLASRESEDASFAEWLHENRVFGVPIQGQLRGNGASAVLELEGETYTAGRELGRGYSSTATLFRNAKTGDHVVVKSLRTENTGKHQIVLYKEHNTLMHLERVLRDDERDRVVLPRGVVIDEDNMPSLVFPFEQGGGLRQNVERLTRFFAAGEIDARAWLNLTRLMMWDIVKAKEMLEGAGVVHIDPRDDNFVVGLDGRVKIIDFGCAEVISQRTGLLPRAALEKNLELPVSYHSGDDLRPPMDTYVGPTFDSYVIGGVFQNMMRPIVEAMRGGCDEVLAAHLTSFADLQAQMLDETAMRRPNARAMLAHPFFDALNIGRDGALRTQMQQRYCQLELTDSLHPCQ